MRIIISILLIMNFAAYSQQDALYSQYMFNPFVINPAYAGSRDAVNVVLVNRNQWVGLKGAPNTQSISAHVPMNRKNIAWGVNMAHDKLGPSNNLVAMATAAYRVRLSKGNLNIGLRGGIYNTYLDFGILKFREKNDALDTQERLSAIVPTFDFGLYYYSSRFFAGLSISHLTNHRFKFSTATNYPSNYLRRHTFFTFGYVFNLKNNLILKPSILLKNSGDLKLNADFNLNLMVNKLFWVGIGFRNFSSLNFLVDLNITDYIRIGYSYDMTMNKLKNYSKGSHELLLGFDFNLKKQSKASPRHL